MSGSPHSYGAYSGEFDERWIQPGGVVPVTAPVVGALVREIQRLRGESGPSSRFEKAVADPSKPVSAVCALEGCQHMRIGATGGEGK